MGRTWTIQQVAQAAGTTSRTLRHYDAIGLLPPTAIGANGYRLYDASALVRLQRILAMRDLGVSLTDIRAVLNEEVAETDALAELHQRLVHESARLQRQIATVRHTLAVLNRGGTLMANEMFDGFRHEDYRDEVEQRWGEDAYATANTWWSSLGVADKRAWHLRMEALNRDWQTAAADGVTPESDVAQDLAARHVAWLKTVPGVLPPEEFPGYVTGLAEMYVSDPRFAANYGGEAGATLVRDALLIYVGSHRLGSN